MKVSKLDRRDFVEAMLLLGLTACGGSRLAKRGLKSARPNESALGPFFQQLARLSDQLERRTIDERKFVREAGARLMELELEEDVLEAWTREGPNVPGEGRNGYRVIHSRELRFDDRPGLMNAVLFYTPAGTSNPPHEHHNLVSCKRVLKGSYHIRQYERIRQVEPGVIAIRQVSELLDVSFSGPYIDMTDDRLNVHWFGAGAEPVLALNIVVENSLRPAETFHGAGETRAAGRYFVDPTGTPDAEGVILAPAVEQGRALEFSRRPLADFPSRLPAPTSRG